MSETTSPQIIMGVDPGTNILGYSVICADKNTIKILITGVIRLNKTDDHFSRLRIIYEKLNSYILEYKPSVLAIEAPFFGKNVQSMLKLGRAQGAAIVAAVNNHIEVIEYSPRRIKQSITGNGNASKEQVAKMLQSTLKMDSLPEFLDATDALAVAVCHSYASKKIAGKGKQFQGWTDFIKTNPGKVSGK